MIAQHEAEGGVVGRVGKTSESPWGRQSSHTKLFSTGKTPQAANRLLSDVLTWHGFTGPPGPTYLSPVLQHWEDTARVRVPESATADKGTPYLAWASARASAWRLTTGYWQLKSNPLPASPLVQSTLVTTQRDPRPFAPLLPSSINAARRGRAVLCLGRAQRAANSVL
jgi:hypothetical protein